MKSFTQGDYFSAMKGDNEAELISKVLYPSDEHFEGKQLRLSQQYFLVSASLQSIIKDHLKNNDSLDNLHEKAAIHINDTHPALAVPELMQSSFGRIRLYLGKSVEYHRKRNRLY